MKVEENSRRIVVSIIIPVYNVDKRIEKSIQSVLDQTMRDIQVILVDDCSTDNSFAYCTKLALTDSRVEVYRHPVNRGVSAARNTGLSHVLGKYVLFVDSDDILDKDMVDVLVRLIEEEDTDLAVCGFYINGRPQYGPQKEKVMMARVQCAKGISGVGGSLIKGYVFNKLFRNEKIVENNLKFDESVYVCEDALFCHQYVWHCKSIKYDPVCKYHYIIHQESATHGKVTQRRMSVLNSYRKIIEIGRKYDDRELCGQLEANYLNHYISLLKDILKQSSGKQREYGDRLYHFMKKKGKLYRKNPYITFKRKILFTFLCFVYPIWKSVPDRIS